MCIYQKNRWCIIHRKMLVTSSRIITLKGIGNVCLLYIYLVILILYLTKYSFFFFKLMSLKSIYVTVVVFLTMTLESNRLIYLLFRLLP